MSTLLSNKLWRRYCIFAGRERDGSTEQESAAHWRGSGAIGGEVRHCTHQTARSLRSRWWGQPVGVLQLVAVVIVWRLVCCDCDAEWWKIFDVTDDPTGSVGASTIFCDVITFMPDYTASHPRRQQYSYVIEAFRRPYFWIITLLLSWPLKMGPIGSPETSVSNHFTPLNNPADGRKQYCYSSPWEPKILPAFGSVAYWCSQWLVTYDEWITNREGFGRRLSWFNRCHLSFLWRDWGKSSPVHQLIR
jgi:hypothetical protein